MKDFIILIIIAFIAFACKEKNTIVVRGKISNPSDEPVGIRINYFDKTDTITHNIEDGTFFYEIDLEEEHLGWFYQGEFSVPLYLVPGATINLEFDTSALTRKFLSVFYSIKSPINRLA